MCDPNLKKRLSFDQVAAIYDKARPNYREEMILDLIESTHIETNNRILEIGIGTGQLTTFLAQKNFRIFALEMGRNLAQIAKNKLSGFSEVRIEVGDFDTYNFEPESFDLAIAATSFHWLDPSTRMARISNVLRRNGMIAIVDTHHVRGGTEQFFIDSQECYEIYDANTVDEYRLPTASEIKLRRWESEASGLFETVFSKTYEWELDYGALKYLELLKTYSDVLSMEKRNREGLLECIKGIIESRYDGRISKKYMTELYVAQKR